MIVMWLWWCCCNGGGDGDIGSDSGEVRGGGVMMVGMVVVVKNWR